MTRRFRTEVAALLLASSLPACGGTGHPLVAATCPPPPPTPPPIPAFLNYPPGGSINVPTTIGEIIEQGADTPGSILTIAVSWPSGNVPLGTPASAPSPLPTPFATPSPHSVISQSPYVAIPLPTLSPSTTYTVTDIYSGYDSNNPPSCSAPAMQFVGTFTTGS